MNGPTPIVVTSYNLAATERLLCSRALESTGNIPEAAKILGITRHQLKRLILKHRITWDRRASNPSARSEQGSMVQILGTKSVLGSQIDDELP